MYTQFFPSLCHLRTYSKMILLSNHKKISDLDKNYLDK